jgi:leader peptidase (prepilin peptidase)/N-methyltransferase
MVIGYWVFLLGVVVGSFLGAYTYRYSRGISIAEGRSECPKCRREIAWYHNIPIVSFLYLRGRCAYCKKQISVRYPLIESAMGIFFVVIYHNFERIYWVAPWLRSLGLLGLALVFVVAAGLVAVFVIDLESQLIPDEITFLLLGIIIAGLVIGAGKSFYLFVLAGLGASVFLLVIHLVTKGRGMGLGDVKLAVPLGAFLGPSLATVWIFSAFVIGGVTGIFLLATSAVRWKSRVAFGPFLVIAFVVVLFYGATLGALILPF